VGWLSGQSSNKHLVDLTKIRLPRRPGRRLALALNRKSGPSDD
jgi:hypothetical protein